MPVQAVYFTVTAVVLYLLADRVLERVEVAAGRRLEHRTIIFFAILLSFALVSFAVIRACTAPG